MWISGEKHVPRQGEQRVLGPCDASILGMINEQQGSSCVWNLVGWVEHGWK